jgi:hypothetical protein
MPQTAATIASSRPVACRHLALPDARCRAGSPLLPTCLWRPCMMRRTAIPLQALARHSTKPGGIGCRRVSTAARPGVEARVGGSQAAPGRGPVRAHVCAPLENGTQPSPHPHNSARPASQRSSCRVPRTRGSRPPTSEGGTPGSADQSNRVPAWPVKEEPVPSPTPANPSHPTPKQQSAPSRLHVQPICTQGTDPKDR